VLLTGGGEPFLVYQRIAPSTETPSLRAKRIQSQAPDLILDRHGGQGHLAMTTQASLL
jgi:hypothetical protein